MIAQQVTQGIKVSVKTQYQDDFSHPNANEFVFSYYITIENTGNQTVQLLSRHWYIFDSCGEYKEVEGEGVVGVQPIIQPGESYSYESACSLKTEIGKMNGTYLMQRMNDKFQFDVEIPEFELITTQKLN